MPTTLDRLPFDILFYISLNLHLDDIVHLSRTCKLLKLHLSENTVCRKAIETYAFHSREAQFAQAQKITYRDALESIYSRRDAFSNAYPFSARVLGSATAFAYRQGILCLLRGIFVLVLDVYASSELCRIKLEDSLSLPDGADRSGHSIDHKISLLYYSDDLLSVHVEVKGGAPRHQILVFRTSSHTSDEERLIHRIPIESARKLFVRHTEYFLFYGTHTAVASDGHDEWEIQGLSLDPDVSLTYRPIQLENFYGSDIGSTVAFEIHDGYFYAVSNQTSLEVEELDWTSFYHCIRFPIENPDSDSLELNTRAYRRQHSEGPIHDSWTDLFIQIEERTNEAVIVESRREWQNAASRNLRTFYSTRFEFGPEITRRSRSLDLTAANGPPLPLDDPLTRLLRSSDNPHYGETQSRTSWNVHPEFLPGLNPPRSFLLARTKVRAYNRSCHSFIDLVEDNDCCGVSPGPCLRIRVGSRRPGPPDWKSLDKAALSSPYVYPAFEAQDDSYRHSTIKMWPPPASHCPCSARLHTIMNPQTNVGSTHNRTITGMADERSLVYLVKSGSSYGSQEDTLGTVVLIDFSRRPPSTKHANHLNSPAAVGGERDWYWTPGQSERCRSGECC